MTTNQPQPKTGAVTFQYVNEMLAGSVQMLKELKGRATDDREHNVLKGFNRRLRPLALDLQEAKAPGLDVATVQEKLGGIVGPIEDLWEDINSHRQVMNDLDDLDDEPDTPDTDIIPPWTPPPCDDLDDEPEPAAEQPTRQQPQTPPPATSRRPAAAAVSANAERKKPEGATTVRTVVLAAITVAIVYLVFHPPLGLPIGWTETIKKNLFWMIGLGFIVYFVWKNKKNKVIGQGKPEKHVPPASVVASHERRQPKTTGQRRLEMVRNAGHSAGDWVDDWLGRINSKVRNPEANNGE